HKFTQHEALKLELLGTGDTELVEDSAEDAFWGIGKHQRGRNELGKALERLRSQLREPWW
ncbi:swarming motility ybiA domain protein, partial [Mycena maculata]